MNGSGGPIEDKQERKEHYERHNDSAISSKQTIATSKRDVRSTAGLQFPVIADTDDIKNIIQRTTDRAIAEILQPPSEEKLHRKMPYKFSCCRNNENGHFMSILDDCENSYANLSHYLHFFIPTPKTASEPPTIGEERKLPRLIPSTLMIVRQISGQTSMHLLHVLLDSGSTRIMINSRALPKGACPELLESTVKSQTLVGSFETKRQVTLESIILPEFNKS